MTPVIAECNSGWQAVDWGARNVPYWQWSSAFNRWHTGVCWQFKPWSLKGVVPFIAFTLFIACMWAL